LELSCKIYKISSDKIIITLRNQIRALARAVLKGSLYKSRTKTTIQSGFKIARMTEETILWQASESNEECAMFIYRFYEGCTGVTQVVAMSARCR
jgi:hypothetical protein